MSTPLQPFPAAPRLVRAEHVVMVGAALALVVLVALPLAFLVAGSVTAEGGVTLAHFREAVSSRLRTFRSVTLPLARPGLFAGWLLVFVPALQELSASILLFSSGSITLAVAVYNLYETGALGPVAALAIVTMLIITAAIVLATRLGRGSAISRAERAGVAQ